MINYIKRTKKNLVGIDIGGTKCAVTYGISDGTGINIVDKLVFPTTSVTETLEHITDAVTSIIKRNRLSSSDVSAIGISCGGPLDSKSGIIMSPPNLPGWDRIPIVRMLSDRFGIKTGIQNDANASALAEWKFGAGKGFKNLIFLTFGTGLGAGLILDGKLFTGANDNAGEIGHIQLSEFGPVGYGKSGSFEGFCSGGGIAQIAKAYITEKIQMGCKIDWCPAEKINDITAQLVAEEARKGDVLALEIFRLSGTYLGKGLAILIDIINPELIIIGSIYTKSEELLAPYMNEQIRKEALPNSIRVCIIKPAALGHDLGDYAALSVAENLITTL